VGISSPINIYVAFSHCHAIQRNLLKTDFVFALPVVLIPDCDPTNVTDEYNSSK